MKELQDLMTNFKETLLSHKREQRLNNTTTILDTSSYLTASAATINTRVQDRVESGGHTTPAGFEPTPRFQNK